MRQLQEQILHHQSIHVSSSNFFSMMPHLLGTETSKTQTEATITKTNNKQLDDAIGKTCLFERFIWFMKFKIECGVQNHS